MNEFEPIQDKYEDTPLIPENFIPDIELSSPIASTPPIQPIEFLSNIQIIQLNVFWFGYQYFWLLVLILLLPKQIKEIVPDEYKGTGLAIVSFVSGVINLFTAVIFGALNDRFTSSYGRRKPWILMGAVGMCFALFLMSPNDSLWFYTLAFLFMTIASILCSVPFNGFIADVTPHNQKGKVSAVMGAMNLCGYLCAAITGAVLDSMENFYILYLIMTIVFLSSTLTTILLTREPLSNFIPVRDTIEWKSFMIRMIEPLWKNINFRLVFLGRFLAQLGITTVQQFLQFWIEDCVVSSLAPGQAVSIALLPLLLLSPIAALLIPHHKRKIVIYISSLLMITSCLLMMWIKSFVGALIISGIFGIGYGPYISTEFAMLMDVLPNAQDVAKDISLWHSALVLPQIFATPIAGVVRDFFQDIGKTNGIDCLGYKILFTFCILYFVLGMEMTRRIRGMT